MSDRARPEDWDTFLYGPIASAPRSAIQRHHRTVDTVLPAVCPEHIDNHSSITIVARPRRLCRLIGCGFSWLGQFARPTDLFVAQMLMLPEDFQQGRYLLIDYVKMFSDMPPVTIYPAFDLTLRLLFDWPDKSWIKSPQTFRFWWKVKEIV